MTEPTAPSVPAGTPCWYELNTSDLAAAGAFYADALGWTVADSGMPGMTYHLATASDGGMVAGLGPVPEADVPPSWVLYFTSDDCDATAAAIAQDGGSVAVQPMDIPGTGRFAICADPQGAVFGILQPAPMEGPMGSPAFNQQATGHGNWHDLMTTDPQAGFAFYAKRFAWATGEAMDMGEMGTYQLFGIDGNDIGGIMPLGDAPRSAWLPYFGVDGVEAAIARITGGGGSIHHGPAEVPGGAHIAVATDPQGGWFAIVGPR
ncbi:MAG: VOC family protein [Actinomycetales bacterium]